MLYFLFDFVVIWVDVNFHSSEVGESAFAFFRLCFIQSSSSRSYCIKILWFFSLIVAQTHPGDAHGRVRGGGGAAGRDRQHALRHRVPHAAAQRAGRGGCQ